MLYKIAPYGDFYELTLKVQDLQEATLVHDEVACRIARSSEFMNALHH